MMAASNVSATNGSACLSSGVSQQRCGAMTYKRNITPIEERVELTLDELTAIKIDLFKVSHRPKITKVALAKIGKRLDDAIALLEDGY